MTLCDIAEDREQWRELVALALYGGKQLDDEHLA